MPYYIIMYVILIGASDITKEEGEKIAIFER